MLKRFIIGFVLGVGAMYWYINYYDHAATEAGQWMQQSASQYRGDRDRQVADQVTGHPKR